jgi:hypothetical protein
MIIAANKAGILWSTIERCKNPHMMRFATVVPPVYALLFEWHYQLAKL